MACDVRDGELMLRTWKVHGTDEDGAPELSTVVLRLNPDWQGGDDEVEYKYHVYYFVADPDDEICFEGADDVQAALYVAAQLRDELESCYAELEVNRRESRALDLEELCSGWADGPDRRLVEAIVAAIEAGDSARLLGVLGI